METEWVYACKAFQTVPGMCWMSVSCQLAFHAAELWSAYSSVEQFKNSPFHIQYRPNSWAWPSGLCCFSPIYFLNLISIRSPHRPLANQNCWTSLCLRFLLPYLYSLQLNFLHTRIPFIFPDSKPNGILFKRAPPPRSSQQEVIYLPCELP